MQQTYSPENLSVVLLSTDDSKELYDSRAEKLFDKYGGGDWPSALIPGGFNGATVFGDSGYGKIIVDKNGMVRSAYGYELEEALKRVFQQEN